MKIFLLALLLSVAACGEAEYTGSKEGEGNAVQRDTVFDPLIESLDRAESVDKLSANRLEQLDREIDGSE